MPRLPALLLAAACALTLGACHPSATVAPADAPVVHGFVTDMAGFDSFIAGRPTPAAFRARYPDVLLVLPGDVSTREMRMNNSRYFADVDADGRITGGRFM